MDRIILSHPERETWLTFMLGECEIQMRTGSVEYLHSQRIERNIRGEVTLIKEYEPAIKLETIGG